ncbi:MAG: 3-hydroxyacyl-ACP dehydratase FabZ [Spirochaetota bacterium]
MKEKETHQQEVLDLLPHRRPFLFLEQIVSADETTTTGSYTFSGDEEFFAGHFPEYPVVPGVLLIETMAQCGGAGLKKTGAVKSESLFFLTTVEKAKFRRQVRPGDTVSIEVENLRVSTSMIKQKGQITVGGEVAAEASWMCIIGE